MLHTVAAQVVSYTPKGCHIITTAEPSLFALFKILEPVLRSQIIDAQGHFIAGITFNTGQATFTNMVTIYPGRLSDKRAFYLEMVPQKPTLPNTALIQTIYKGLPKTGLLLPYDKPHRLYVHNATVELAHNLILTPEVAIRYFAESLLGRKNARTPNPR